MGKYSEAFVAFDVAKKKHAIAIAEGGRTGEVRFLGDVEDSPLNGPVFGERITLPQNPREGCDSMTENSPVTLLATQGANNLPRRFDSRRRRFRLEKRRRPRQSQPRRDRHLEKYRLRKSGLRWSAEIWWSRQMFSSFECNICGTRSSAEIIRREFAPCRGCGSTPRLRASMIGLSVGLFGRTMPLTQMRPDPGIRGFGCSDAPAYAAKLAELFDYSNTYLHEEPRVDICDVVTLRAFSQCRFIVCSDVLEHVLTDPALAIRNMYACLAPNGCLVLSAPTYDMTSTIEKYPSLRQYTVAKIGDRHVVVYESLAGSLGFDADPVFHGGPGSVLEMRLFAHDDLLRHVIAAGFKILPMPDGDALHHGAVWLPEVRHDLPYPLDGRVVIAVKLGTEIARSR
jgi:SAM-dependent methyltransferase